MQKNRLYVIVTLDVEEEGLFSGTYAQHASVSNVTLLSRLAPLSQELGFPLTLFCTHSVFANKEACTVLAKMRDDCHAEIAAHLHHWSTPPFAPADSSVPERTDRLATALLQERLHNLLTAGKTFQAAPLTSFRMGRWDLKNILFPMLVDAGILVDSSICPLRAFCGGPDHFLAPSNPYWFGCGSNEKALLEIPITQVTPVRQMANIWYSLTRKKRKILDTFHFWGALSANPVWHNNTVMRMATRCHIHNGGKVLNLFWHSSEMMPGGSPHIPDQKAADALLKKITDFLCWLKQNHDVAGITMTDYYKFALANDIIAPRPSGQGDW